MPHLLAIRHGHADWTPDENRPLSASGRMAAAKLPAVLADYAITAIYSSPYARARQTVQPLAEAREIEIRECPDLRERQLGEIGEVPWAEASRRTWEDPDRPFPGGESNQAAQARIVTIVDRLIRSHPLESFAIATHGTLLALLLQTCDPRYGHAFWTRMTMPDVYLLHFDQQGVLTVQKRLWQPEAD